MGKLPILLDNQAKGNYKVHLDLGICRIGLYVPREPELHRRCGNPQMAHQCRFSPGTALGIDRDQLNETFWLGVGTPGLARARRDHAAKSRTGMAQEVVDARCGAGQWDARRDRLAKKDADGFRVRTDNGDRLRLQVIAIAAFLPYPKLSEMVADQWRKIGIQADVKEMERGLGFAKQTNNEHQLFVWNNGGTELLYLFPTWAVPVVPGAAFAPEYRRGTASGGKQGTKPDDPNILKIFDLYTEAAGLKAEGRNKNAQEIWKILVDQQYGIGTVGQSPAGLGVRLVSNRLGNIAARVCNAQHCRTPGNSHPETWTSRHAFTHHCEERSDEAIPIAMEITSLSTRLRRVLDVLAYLARRLVLAAITTFAITVVTFIILHLPPVDFVTAYAAQAAASGTAISAAEADAMRLAYGLNQPLYVQYWKWLAMVASGDFGRSFEYGRPVTEVIGDRLWLTVLLSLGAVVVTWGLALPIGIYSAVRQYSLGDYVFTFLASSVWPSQTSCWH